MKHLLPPPIFYFFLFCLIAACRNNEFAAVKNSNLGKNYTVKGYFAKDPIPMLVKDTVLFKANTPMPLNDYLLIEGIKSDSAGAPQAKTYGAYVTVRGKVAVSKDTSIKEQVLLVEDLEVNSTASNAGTNPPVLELCTLDPSLCSVSTPSPQKFALLFSGGAAPADARNRYWNDLAFMYLTLKSQYGYSDANIVVVYKDGMPATLPNGSSSTDMLVDFPATQTGFDAAISDLQTRMGNDPAASLFVFTTNHGGGYRKLVSKVKGGASDYAPYDESPLDNNPLIDETIFLYGSANSYIIDDYWSAQINTLAQVNGVNRLLVTVNEPCFSGGFIKDLNGPNRVNIAAASEFEYSYSMGDGRFDEFSYHFTAALHGKEPLTGAIVNANQDTDPRISILEAYWYAAGKDQSPATSYLDDNGDGAGTANPPLPSIPLSGTPADGVLASTIFL